MGDLLIDMEEEKVCEFCGGMKTVPYPIYNEDSHEYEDIGERVCVCQMDLPTEPEDTNNY